MGSTAIATAVCPFPKSYPRNELMHTDETGRVNRPVSRGGWVAVWGVTIRSPSSSPAIAALAAGTSLLTYGVAREGKRASSPAHHGRDIAARFSNRARSRSAVVVALSCSTAASRSRTAANDPPPTRSHPLAARARLRSARAVSVFVFPPVVRAAARFNAS